MTDEPPDTLAGTRELLLGYIDYYRAALLRKLDGMPEDDLRTSRLPSGWSPLARLESSSIPSAVLVHSVPGALCPPGQGMDPMLLPAVNGLRARSSSPDSPPGRHGTGPHASSAPSTRSPATRTACWSPPG